MRFTKWTVVLLGLGLLLRPAPAQAAANPGSLALQAYLEGDDAGAAKILKGMKKGQVEDAALIALGTYIQAIQDEEAGPKAAVQHAWALQLLQLGAQRFKDKKLAAKLREIQQAEQQAGQPRQIALYLAPLVPFVRQHFKADGAAHAALYAGRFAEAVPYFQSCAADADAAAVRTTRPTAR